MNRDKQTRKFTNSSYLTVSNVLLGLRSSAS